MPVVAPGQVVGRIHPLLYDGPLTGFVNHEGMQVELKAIGNGVVVHARGEPAGAGQFIAIQPSSTGEFTQLVGRSLRVPATTAANGKAQLGKARIETALERSHDGG